MGDGGAAPMEVEMGEDVITMCEKVHGIGSEEALKALKQWLEVYRARKGLFSCDMVWQAARMQIL